MLQKITHNNIDRVKVGVSVVQYILISGTDDKPEPGLLYYKVSKITEDNNTYFLKPEEYIQSADSMHVLTTPFSLERNKLIEDGCWWVDIWP